MSAEQTGRGEAHRSPVAGRPPLSLLDSPFLKQVSLVLAFGASKYGRDNWRGGQSYNRCIDSILRHIVAFAEGESYDKETGLHHLAHAACSIMFLLRFEHDGRKDLDDRYIAPVAA
jgi:hypothetical protein